MKYIAPSLPYIDLFLADLKHVPTRRLNSGPTVTPPECWITEKTRRSGQKNHYPRAADSGLNADETSVKAITDFAADELHVAKFISCPTTRWASTNITYLSAL